MDGDIELIGRVKSGDSLAFEELVKRYEKKVYNIALRICGNPDDAYDLSQESFLRIYKSLDFFRGESSLGTWIYRLTANVCIDFMRREKKKPRLSLSSDDDGQGYYDIPDLSFCPEHELEKKETAELLKRLLAELTPEYRMALVLRAVGGLSYTEIAEALDIEDGTVKSRIFRGREQLRKSLLRSGNFDAPDASKAQERK